MKVFRSIYIACIAVLITGCFSSESDDAGASRGTHSYATNEFRISIPNEWEIIEPAKFQSTIPPSTVIAFRNNVADEIYTSNVVIVRNPLSIDITSQDYVLAVIEKTKRELAEFQEISVEPQPMTIGGNPENSLFTIVRGRNALDAEIKEFVIFAGSHERTAYIALGSYLPKEPETTKELVQEMVRSFEIR